MSTTSIQWTDAVWNPVRGCSLVSAGCTNCYAMKQARRFSGAGQPYEGLTKQTSHGPVWTGAARPIAEMLDRPFHWSKGRRIFVNSMSDLFHEDVPFQFIADVFATMSVTTRHTYQVLTKRPQRMLDFFAWLTMHGEAASEWPGQIFFPEQVDPLRVWPKWIAARGNRAGYDNCGPGWPCENVWIGVSVEDQATADERIPLLLQTPAAVRFLSCEPLLEAVDVRLYLSRAGLFGCDSLPGINWAIVGGESGPGARPFDVAWARSIRDQCRIVSVPVFVKQLGSKATSDHRTRPAGENSYWTNIIRDRAGGDMAEWPVDLRVREFPRVAA